MGTSGKRSTTAAKGRLTTPGGRVWRVAVSTLALAGLLATGACSSNKAPSWQGGTSSRAAEERSGAPGAPAASRTSAVITAPQANATDVPLTTDVSFTTENGEHGTVEVKDARGQTVKGQVLADGKTWRPDQQLNWGTTYTASVTTTTDGKTGTTSNTFRTMARPAKLVGVSSFLGDGQVVGVGMPLIVRFGRSIPSNYRAEVQRRMTVQSTPSQPGIWNWISPTEVHYRPPTYWQANTKIFYQLQLTGVPVGDGWYGRNNLTVDLKIGRAFVMTVDNKTKQMTVQQDGKVIKTIPVSLGKPSTPSSSGTMVVIEKKRKTVFDTMAELGPEKGYRTDIDFAQRITWSGQFIHAAPWSEGVQGKRNVSHGCVNVSMKMGEWLFQRTMLGDPITVRGTEQRLKNGNGWTDWNMPWSEYVKGSALPA